MASLSCFQSLWATEDRHPERPESPVEERFERVKADGWDGLCIDLGSMAIDKAKATVPLFQRNELRGLLTAFPDTIEGLRPAIHLAKEIGAPYVIVVGAIMPLKVEEMVTVIRDWMRIGQEEAMPLQFETHRNCITNDLFSTLQLIETIPEMRLSADLSHYVVQREMIQPISEEYQRMLRQILDRSDSLQGRIGTRNQIQVPIDFPQHQIWVESFLEWWRYGVQSWKSRTQDNDELIFLSELGPREYAMTGRDGEELSDRKAEALKLRKYIETIWAESESA